jgi:RNA polymerase sigma-70 factor (ECF subfamily)
MRNTTSDEDILEIFVKTGDELAFRQLAERYSGLIFHTALRTLKNRTLAEDVTQRVLSVLARKASHVAQSGAPLPAWLHRTTLLEAKSVRRSEFRHHRKKEALMNAPTESAHVESSAWQDALPHLDAAIDTLPEADRHVLLLHFVNELTFPEIARRVGKSAAAVQKQSRRALEELQRTLRRRGVTLSIGILTAGLTAEMAKAAPLLLIPALSTLSTLGKTTTSAIVVKKSTLAAVGTTLLLCGIPLARQQASIRELEARSQLSVDSSNPGSSRTRNTGTAGMSLVHRLVRDLKSQDSDVPRYRGAVEFLDELDDEALISLIQKTTASPMPSDDRIVLLDRIFESLANRDPQSGRVSDPEKALNAMMDHLPADLILRHQRLPEYLRSLSETDGARALAWFLDHLDEIRAIKELEVGPKTHLESKTRIGLAYGLIFSNPTEAVSILRSLPPSEIISEFDQLVRSVEPSLRKDSTGFIQVTRELLPEKEATEVIANLHQIDFDYIDGVFAKLDVLLGKYQFSEPETEAIIRQAAANTIFQASSSGKMHQAIAEYKDWLESRYPAETDQRVGEALGHWAANWGGTERIYDAMLNYKDMGLSDDAMIALLNSLNSRFGVEKIEALARLLADHEQAAKIISRIKSPATE